MIVWFSGGCATCGGRVGSAWFSYGSPGMAYVALLGAQGRSQFWWMSGSVMLN